MLQHESFTLTPQDLTTYGKWWALVFSTGGVAGGGNANRVAGRSSGGWAFQSSGTGGSSGGAFSYLQANLGSDVQRVTFGCAFQFNSGPSGMYILQFLDSNSAGINVYFNTALRTMTIQRGGTTLFTTTVSYGVGRWHYLEIAMFISSTVGWIEARLDSASAGGYYGSTGTNRATANGNTQGGTLAGVRFVNVGGNNIGANQPWDLRFTDLVIMNGAATDAAQPNNDFLGDIRVVGLPTSGVGAHTDFAIGGTVPQATNWQSVNRSPVPGDASFVTANAVNNQDTYALTDLPAGTLAVYALSVGVITRKTDAGVRNVTPLLRWAAGGPLDVPMGAGAGLQTTYGYIGSIQGVRPDNAAWTPADINALEAGERITA